jgi:hypothetical protein
LSRQVQGSPTCSEITLQELPQEPQNLSS